MHAKKTLIELFNISRFSIASFSYMGQILVNRKKFIEVGGFDTTLNDTWAPDDIDFIARYVIYFSENYMFMNQGYTLELTFNEDHNIEYLSRRAKNFNFIRTEAPENTPRDFLLVYDTKFYKRINYITS